MTDYNPYSLNPSRPAARRQREYAEWGDLLATVVDPSEHWFARVYVEAHRVEQYGVEITEDILRNILLCFHRDWMEQLEAIKERDKQTDKERDVSVVYYMRIGERVKIGTTTNLKKRMASIGPEELLATEPGWYDLEKQRHAQFTHYRVKGEWFRYEGAVKQHVMELRKKLGWSWMKAS